MIKTFQSNYKYTDRKSKARYIYLKYKPILKGKILDVGSDQCYLRQYLGNRTSYLGIGLVGNLDKKINLEKEKIPVSNNSFDCVICTDVLEHLENIHDVFDDLCRASRKWVIISLPNPWNDFFGMLRNGYYEKGFPMKYYNLPPERPEDRHKWFFSPQEAKNFITYRAAKNQMKIIQIDNQNTHSNAKTFVYELGSKILFKKSIKAYNFYTGTIWAVLKKQII